MRIFCHTVGAFLGWTLLSVWSVSCFAVEVPVISTSGLIVEEVLSQSQDAHEYDWRKIPIQIEIGYASINEFNSFDSEQTSFGVARSFGPGLIGRGVVRRVTTSGTGSSQALALTPFSQAGMPSRYEFLIGAGYALLEGRSLTPLSPKVSDLGHALYALAGVQYNNYFDNQNPEPVPGMRALRYEYVMELGTRFQIYFPHALGLSLEWTYSIPLQGSDPDLKSWQKVGGNVSWSFGR